MSADVQTHWRNKLQQVQVDYQISWWKMKYPESLMSKAFDFLAVGQDSMAQTIFLRIDAWISQQELPQAKSQDLDEGYEPFKEIWSQERLEETLSSLEGRLQGAIELIPRVEFQDFQYAIRECRQLNQENKLTETELWAIRLKLVDRVKQSLLTMGDLKALKEQVQKEVHVETIGPYNNKQNFSEAFQILSESDPIWAGDFLELYSVLFGLEDKVASVVVKRK